MIGLLRGIIPLCPARKDGCQYNKRGRGRGSGLGSGSISLKECCFRVRVRVRVRVSVSTITLTLKQHSTFQNVVCFTLSFHVNF